MKAAIERGKLGLILSHVIFIIMHILVILSALILIIQPERDSAAGRSLTVVGILGLFYISGVIRARARYSVLGTAYTTIALVLTFILPMTTYHLGGTALHILTGWGAGFGMMAVRGYLFDPLANVVPKAHRRQFRRLMRNISTARKRLDVQRSYNLRKQLADLLDEAERSCSPEEVKRRVDLLYMWHRMILLMEEERNILRKRDGEGDLLKFVDDVKRIGKELIQRLSVAVGEGLKHQELSGYDAGNLTEIREEFAKLLDLEMKHVTLSHSLMVSHDNARKDTDRFFEELRRDEELFNRAEVKAMYHKLKYISAISRIKPEMSFEEKMASEMEGIQHLERMLEFMKVAKPSIVTMMDVQVIGPSVGASKAMWLTKQGDYEFARSNLKEAIDKYSQAKSMVDSDVFEFGSTRSADSLSLALKAHIEAKRLFTEAEITRKKRLYRKSHKKLKRAIRVYSKVWREVPLLEIEKGFREMRMLAGRGEGFRKRAIEVKMLIDGVGPKWQKDLEEIYQRIFRTSPIKAKQMFGEIDVRFYVQLGFGAILAVLGVYLQSYNWLMFTLLTVGIILIMYPILNWIRP
jgi:tetratricopeptide (TPR) repeat protein